MTGDTQVALGLDSSRRNQHRLCSGLRPFQVGKFRVVQGEYSFAANDKEEAAKRASQYIDASG